MLQTRPHLTQIQSTDMEKHPYLLSEMLEILGDIEFLKEVAPKGTFETFALLDSEVGKEVGFYTVVSDETYYDHPTKYYFTGEELYLLGGRAWDDIFDLQSRSVKAVVNTREDLAEVLGEEGFYKVISDETYRGNPTEYYYDGESIHFLTEKIPSEALKKTAVFYMKRLIQAGQEIGIYIPYMAILKEASVHVLNPSTEDLVISVKGEGGELVRLTLPQGSNIITEGFTGSISNSVISVEVISGELQLEGIDVGVVFIPVDKLIQEPIGAVSDIDSGIEVT